MNRKSKSFITAFLLLAVALIVSVGSASAGGKTAYADTGPKPSVTVTVEGVGDRTCYGTLLSFSPGVGPHGAYSSESSYLQSTYDPKSDHYDAEQHAIWQAFVDYDDPDGYYYLQTHWRLEGTDTISWSYYPPSKFKVLLYFPETQEFASSGVYEWYAFHSYFTASVSDAALSVSPDNASVSPTGEVSVRKSYDYTLEIVSLFARIIVTVLIELGVAWLFKMRTKNEIISVVVVNVITQTILNIALNLLTFFNGAWGLKWYLPLELAVFLLEAVAYGVIFNRLTRRTERLNGVNDATEYLSAKRCVLFSFVANLLSFAAGVVLIRVIPGVF